MRALLAALFSIAVTAHATTTFTVTFDQPTQSGNPGDSITFLGTLTNNTPDSQDVNSDSFTFAINGALDDSIFLNNAPPSVAGNTTSIDFAMFVVNIPVGQTAGPYAGTFTILGGPTANDPNGMDQDNLGSGSIEVDVNGAVPEPATIWLINIALLLLIVVIYTTRSKGVRGGYASDK